MALHFEVQDIFLQFQLVPPSGSLVIVGEKTIADEHTDGQDETNVPPASSVEA